VFPDEHLAKFVRLLDGKTDQVMGLEVADFNR
jgi:hypothetical protein